jgi:molybdopterin-guanine dinucleotide biosynthesis protein A
MNFSAVILAGGKSSRMGRDKAFLEVGGQTLLARQIETVRAAGATEVFISGRAEKEYSAFAGRVITDRFPDAGPLAGIEAALATVTNPLLLVLAVDLPEITREFLLRLRAGCSAHVGIIPRVGKNIEPLVAFYPKSSRAIADRRLRGQICAVRDFADECVLSGLARSVDVSVADAIIFKNYNVPDDLPCKA